MLDYFEKVSEADEDVKLTGQSPHYPPAPKLLVLYNRLKEWNTLPLAGGYLNQPCLLMRALGVVRDAFDERRRIERINLRLQQEEVVAKPTTSTTKTQGLPRSRTS